MIVFILLLAVSVVSAQELDFHGDPFAVPPYSWKQLDITWNKVKNKIKINCSGFHLVSQLYCLWCF